VKISYDGDCVNFYLIPKELNELCDANASPATQLRYESTDDFIWKPNQDMLYGLTLATRIVPNDNDSKAPKYMTLEDALKDYDTQTIMYPTDHIYMNGKITSLSREVVSDIIRKPISDLYGEGYVNAKNLSVLLAYIYSLSDFTAVYQKLVEYALEVLTLEGATVPSLEEMVSLDTSDFTDEMKELINKAQSDPRYHLELEKLYKEYIERSVKGLSKDLTRRVEDSGRMKMKQITDMVVPQLTVSPSGDYYIATNSLVNGLSYEDYIHHCVNNRTLLQMKQELTPNSGYCNRQLIQAGQGIKMSRGGQTGPNEGVWIPRNKAEGRTTLDGEVLGPSDSKELVLVKSFAVSENGVMTPELVSETANMFHEQSNIGLKMTSATAGSITQGALSLKHQGTLLELNKRLQLKAKSDCKVRKLTKDTIEIVEDSGVRYNHFIPSDFILANPKGEYKEGEIIGFRDKFTDPGFKGRTMIDFLGATSTEDMTWKGRIKDYSLCVTPVGGTIHYDMEYVHIGKVAIPRNPERVYYYFEGENIPPYTIICDGVLDMMNIVNYCPNNRDYYGCFRAFFLSILPQINEQTIEYIFTTITTRTVEGRIEYTGVKEKVREDKSFITNVGYEGASKIIPEMLGSVAEVSEENTEDRDLFFEYYLTLLGGHL